MFALTETWKSTRENPSGAMTAVLAVGFVIIVALLVWAIWNSRK